MFIDLPGRVATPGSIARATGYSVDRVRHVMRTRGIAAVERFGRVPVLDEAAAEELLHELDVIEATRLRLAPELNLLQ